jgi:magnesium chelatase family protein
MLAKVSSCAVVGLDGEVVQVEVDISQGLPAFSIVGLPDTAVQEAKERVRSAVRNSGHEFPLRRITVNLAPADLRKEGPSYDLPIAVGILMASGQVPSSDAGSVFLGELSLDGQLRHTNGVLPMVALARDRGYQAVYLPAGDAGEASLIDGVQVVPVTTLSELSSHLQDVQPIAPFVASEPAAKEESTAVDTVDFRHIRGQEHVKRALEVAAAGAHNVIMTGPPGAGKTLLARAMPGILTTMTPEEALAVTKIYSVAGLLPQETPMVQQRPFRSPHQRPGEITLSHRGVLFLDELPEFPHSVLESIRQPMEDGVVTVSRAQGTVTFPASFMLVAAMNPCPCGFYGDPTKQCTCSPSAVTRYQHRISGPLLDRIDIFVDVPRVEYEKLTEDVVAESSAEVRARVEASRWRQRLRFSESRLVCNAEMGPVEVREYCQRILEDGAQALLRMAMNQLNLSARAFHRVLKLARTIADLDGSDGITSEHLAEALQYRQRGGG